MENDIATSFQEFAQKLFAGSLPDQFSQLDSELFKKAEQIIEKQKANDFYQLNYASFIIDMMEISMPGLKKKWGENYEFSEEEIKNFRYNNRVLLASIYLTEIQANTTSPWRRIELCHFIIMFLNTAKEIYSIEVIENQDDFLNKVSAHKQMVESNLKHAHAQTIALSKFNMWKYGNDKLKLLDELLKRNDFLDSTSDITFIFSDSLSHKAIWKSKLGALVYMLYLINGRQNEIGNQTISAFAAKSFKLEEKELDSEKLSKSLSDVKRRYQTSSAEKPEYLKLIEDIVSKVIV